MIESEAHVGIGREVENHVAARHGAGQRRGVEIVAAHEREVRMRLCLFQKAHLAGGEIVPRDHGGTFREQAVNETAANEAGPTGDEDAVHDA